MKAFVSFLPVVVDVESTDEEELMAKVREAASTRLKVAVADVYDDNGQLQKSFRLLANVWGRE